MSRYLFFIAALFLTTEIIAQQITNIQVTQEGDNVVITYDLTASQTGQTFDVEVKCSADNGKTFSITLQSLTGDLKEITAGTAKRIVWDVLSERQELVGAQFVFQLVATPNKPKDSFGGNSGTFVDSRDGHVYKWVKIGTQIWMAENLAYLPSVYLPSDRSQTSPRYYVYDYDGTNTEIAINMPGYKTYGVLYNWAAVKVACPKGWHIPNDYEWDAILNFLGGAITAGCKLKEAGTSHWLSPNKNSTNETGFMALPGGFCKFDGTFHYQESEGYWWSFTEKNEDFVWGRKMYSNYSSVSRFDYGKINGLSVRCLKD
ncbi:MAG: fibrobacter succinogenes major paralogous domain-containing protein [Prolixibacteraceae bacterium]|nr:fibrobacter succinogenes major paralogous domain-containing protein [Prolixibacteraceae bacterium]